MTDLSTIESAFAMAEMGEVDISLAYLGAEICEKYNTKMGLHRMNIETLEDEECFQMFRFFKEDLYHLKDCLNLPDRVVCRNGTTESGINTLAILLRRLAYPNRLCDLVPIVGRSVQEISEIFYAGIEHIYDNFHDLITDINAPFWLSNNYLDTYCGAVSRKGSVMNNIWGFIDGTCRPIARPSRYQKVVFSGHHRTHCLKFQSVVIPNGLIANLFGPVEGSRHDSFLLRESNLLNNIENKYRPDGSPYSLYGDQGYPLRGHLICPFKGANLTDEQRQFNHNMSGLRESVEWDFKDVICQFSFLDFKKNLKIFLQPVGKFYIVAGILTNCRTCVYGNQTSQYFNLMPPSLQSYLSNRV